MANDQRLLITQYTGRVRVSSRKALALALLLRKSAAADITATQRRKLTALEQSAQAVDDVQAARDRLSSASIQPLRMDFARGWSSFALALEAASNAHPAVFAHPDRAAHLRATLLPDGREFTKLSAVEAWTHGRRLLARIESERLTDEVTEIAGARYLETAKFVTAQLGEALGLGESVRKVPSATAINDAMEKFTTALSAYTRALAADVDEDDVASCQRFLDAVGPIDDYRTGNTSNDASELEVPAPIDPSFPSPFVTSDP